MKKKIMGALALCVILASCGGKKEENTQTETTPQETVVITQATTEAKTTVTTAATTTTQTTTEATEPEYVYTMAKESGELTIRDELRSYVNQNSDTAGWIRVGGTMINDPVVQCDNNDYYLNHNFYGNSYYGGTIFADYRGKVNDYTQNQCNNIILYGHNQADGTMFGTLSKYKIKKENTSNFDFYKNHPTFEFSNLYHNYVYKIIATFVLEVEPYQVRPEDELFDYQNFIIFVRDHEKYNFDNWMDHIMERSEIITGVDTDETDKYCTLSTCSNEFDQSRLIVVGRRVRQDESEEVDTSAAKLNPDAKEPDWSYIYYGR
ncbi:MAG: class B sortase [Oscillospiraceae bacterium]|nr:class B sortase [Oscillospiraceae bacterium]